MTIGCSQQKATKAEFSFTIGAISTTSFPGGLMIYGQNATKTAVFGQRHFSGPMALDLQNGDWQFFAVGWAGTSPMTGTTRCALASAKLAGEPVSVNLNLTAATCALPAFVPSSAFLATSTPQTLSLHACNDLTGLTAASDCTGRVSEHRSFRVVFPSYRGSADKVEHLEASDLRGTCVPANATGLAATSNTIPAGSDRFYLATEIQAFTSTDCSGDPYGYLFKNGLTRGDEDTETLVFDAGNITKVFVLYDEVSSPPPTPPGPLAPIALSYQTPMASSSMNGSVAVSGNLDPAGIITLHADMTCMSTPVGTQAFAGDPTLVAFTVPMEGNYLFYAKQTVAGVESPCSAANLNIIIDATPPSPPTSLSWTSGSTINVTTAQLTWMPASDLGAGMFEQEISLFSDVSCTVPYGASTILPGGATTYSFGGLVDGTYYAKIVAKDQALNTAPSNCSPPITVDTVAPIAASALTIPMGPTNASTLTLTWTRSSSPDLSSQELLISNDSMCTGLSNTIPLPGMDTTYPLPVTAGFYSYKVRSIDFAGNVSDSPCSNSVEVDQVISAPTSLSRVSPASSPSASTTVAINVSGVENGALVTLFSDPSCITPISSSVVANAGSAFVTSDALMVDGVVNFYARQTDVAGNVSPCSAAFSSYELDTTPPPMPVLLGVSGNSDTIIDSLFAGGTTPVFHWNPEPNLLRFDLGVFDSTSFPTCSYTNVPGNMTSHAYMGCTISSGETYTVKLRAVDLAGNVSPEATMKIVSSWITPIAEPIGTRYEATAIVNNSNQVILWGGYVNGALSNSGTISNNNLSAWSALTAGNELTPRRGHAAVWTGSEMWVWGGDNGSTVFNDFGRMSGTGVWVPPTAPSIDPATDMAYGYSTSHSKMIVWGGRTVGSIIYRNTGSTFDGSNWVALPATALEARSNPMFGVAGNYFIVWGGRNASTAFANGMRYNFSIPGWEAMATSPLAGRFNAASTMVNGKLVIWGGQNLGGGRFNDGAIYDPIANTWTLLETAGAPPAYSEMMLASDGQRLYFRGGINAAGTREDALFMYDLQTNQWNPLVQDGRPAGITQGSFIKYGQQFLLLGGKDPAGNPTTNVRLLKPAP